MSKLSPIIILFYSLSTYLIGQEVTLTGGFNPYEAYYIGAINLETGESDVPLFNFLVSGPDGVEIEFNIRFKIEILSPKLGFSTRTTLLEIGTNTPMKIEHPIYLDNKNFNITSTGILDVQGNTIPVELVLFDMLEDMATYDNMLSSVVTLGRLPNGIYDFTIKLFDFSTDQSDIIRTETINITSPTSLNLIYPGGALTDTAQNIIYTAYPVFQWSTETCFTNMCKLFIRVAEFNSSLHSSPDEAIEDVTSLPIDQIEGWEEMINAGTSYQYPVSGARDLEEGNLYAWQIKKELPTTLGTDTYLSPISIFKLADQTSANQGQVLSEPILIALKDLLGEDNFDAYFGSDGEFANYLPSDTFKINNENTTSNDILKILDQLLQGTISVVNISVE